MARPSRSKQLLHKAEAALLSAIEVYNKPDFKYREETFAILMLNAWELLLKSKLLDDNDNKLNSLYEYQPRKTKKGVPSKKAYAVKNRSGAHKTKGLGPVIVELDKKANTRLAPEIRSNLDALGEIRDNAVHFYNTRPDLAKLVLELGSASIKNFIELARRWFGHDLSGYSLYLLPIGFVSTPAQAAALPASSDEALLIKYLTELITAKPSAMASEFSVALNVNVSFRKATATTSAALNVTRDPSAPMVQLTEQDIRNMYPWNYKEMTEHAAKRYSDFKMNNKFHDLHRPLKADARFTKERLLNPENPTGISKYFYNPNILKELDKHYTRI